MRELVFRDYQQGAYEFALENPKAGLLMEMGLGKTAVALSVARFRMKADLSVKKTLVVAPKNVAASVWTDERDEWDCFRHLKISLIMGSTPVKRLEGLKADADIYVTNVDNIAWLVDLLLTAWPFDFIIFDESSLFKNPSSIRFTKIQMVLPYLKYAMILTGTPFAEGMHDFWAQVFLLDQGFRLGETITAYRNEYLKPDKVGQWGVQKWGTTESNEKRILEKVEDICISLKTKDYLKLPELMIQDHKITLSDKIKKLYDEFEKEKVLEFFDTHTERQINAVNMGVLNGKLIQFASGSVYDEEKQDVHIHSEKLNMVEELIELANGEPVLIAYYFKHSLKQLIKRFGGHVYKAGDAKAWNEKKFPIMYIHPKSGAHGLNLQFGGCFLIMYSPIYSSEQWEQLIKRLHRPGQKHTVMVHRVLARGTMDIDCARITDAKGNKQSMLMDALKWRHKKYKK